MASKLHLQKANGIPNTKYQNDHARAHAKNLETKRYPCKPCGSHFVTATVLKKHLLEETSRGGPELSELLLGTMDPIFGSITNQPSIFDLIANCSVL